MYRFSRSIFRELAPDAVHKRLPSQSESNLQRVLQSCELTMERLATDRRYFSDPAQSLFNDIRIFFPMNKQYKVLRVIEHHMELALKYLAMQTEMGIGLDGNPLRCRATTRKGKPCQRVPLPNSQYCPSHQHLEEPVREPALSA